MYLGPRTGGPLEAADEVDAGRARSEVDGARRRADGRRRDPIEAVDLVLDVADDRANDEARALALLPLADVPATTTHRLLRDTHRSMPHAVTTSLSRPQLYRVNSLSPFPVHRNSRLPSAIPNIHQP